MILQRECDVKMLKSRKGKYDTAEYDPVISWIAKAKVRMACHQKLWDYNFRKSQDKVNLKFDWSTQNKARMTWNKRICPINSLKHKN